MTARSGGIRRRPGPRRGRGPARTALAATACLVAPLAFAGCESTQEKSERIAASLGPVKQEKGLEITEESTDVEVLDTTLLTDEFGSAVVVELRNTSSEPQVNVPIAIDVLDRKGESVYRNDIPGIEPALAGMPFIDAGATAYWVHNQVLATGEPKEVEVTVGATEPGSRLEVPELELSEPELRKDPVSGIEVTGSVVNPTGELYERILIYAVATDGDDVIAAGRGAVEQLKAGKRRPYAVFFIGDPSAGEIALTHFPSPETAEAGQEESR